MGCVFSGRAKGIIRPRSAIDDELQLDCARSHLEPSAGGSTRMLMMNSLAGADEAKNDKFRVGNKPSILSMLMRQSANQVESHFTGSKSWKETSKLQASSNSPAPSQKQLNSRKRKLQASSCTEGSSTMTNNNDHNNNKTLEQTSVKPSRASLAVAEDETEDAVLFTCIQQLCHEVVSKRLLIDARQGHSTGKVLCLFLFGRPGSSKGELAFELVQHSPLMKALYNGIHRESTDNCPLYHHLDVAAIIVANIDARIREYNQLVAKTTADRQKRVDSPTECDKGSDADSSDENEYRSSLSSSQSSSSVDEGDQLSRDSQHLTMAEELGQVTLSTKQRSILQLKLMKYFNSVTSKWVFDLIEAEVDKLETQLRSQRPELCEHLYRVYLINLVPNQPSLFKSCLFLHQDPQFKEFKYPLWALKFERRTNIKLLSKKRPLGSKQVTTNGADSAQLPKASSPLPNLNLTGLRLSILAPKSPGQQHKAEQDLRAIAGNLLADGLNEKLGPKFNDQFAQHFKSAYRLINIRYNPSRDYNYAHHDESDESNDQDLFVPFEVHKRRLSCARYLHNRRCKLLNMKVPTTKTRQLSSSMQSLVSPHNETQQHRPTTTGDRLLLSPLPPNSSSMSSIISSISSEDSLLSDCTKVKQTGESFHKSPKTSNIKWAVELQLFDSTASHQTSNHEANTSLPLASYQDPKTVRRSSRSPLMFVASPLQHQKATRNSLATDIGAYQLVLIRVAYANEQSQVMLEAQRMHPRPLKLKSESDLARMSKLVQSASVLLASDCNGWLKEALTENNGKDQQPKDHHLRRKHSTGLSQLANEDKQIIQPALVVYTIRVDVARLGLGTFKYPSDFNLSQVTNETVIEEHLSQPTIIHQPVPILTLNNRPASAMDHLPCDDPASNQLTSSSCIKQRPSSSRSAQLDRPKRHVQFKLNQAPVVSQPDNMDANDGDVANLSAQKRQWLGDSVFVSSLARDAEVNKLFGDLVALVKWANVAKLE